MLTGTKWNMNLSANSLFGGIHMAFSPYFKQQVNYKCHEGVLELLFSGGPLFSHILGSLVRGMLYIEKGLAFFFPTGLPGKYHQCVEIQIML